MTCVHSLINCKLLLSSYDVIYKPEEGVKPGSKVIHDDLVHSLFSGK